MSPLLAAREEVLGRIRAALPGDPESVAASYASIHRTYSRRGTLARNACIDLFIDRLIDYDAEVIQLDDETGLAEAIARVLRNADEDRLLVAPDLPKRWHPAHLNPIVDHALTTEAIDRAQAVLTTCEVAIASTGTIVLVHSGAQGRRIATLLPDHHICLVERCQVHELVPEAFAALDRGTPAPVTTISGPSATSDIEMTRIRGVHGPRRLTVILYGRAASSRTIRTGPSSPEGSSGELAW